jgi:hypothetical protein
MADLPDVLSSNIGPIVRKVYAYYGDIGYMMHDPCMNMVFRA